MVELWQRRLEPRRVGGIQSRHLPRFGRWNVGCGVGSSLCIRAVAAIAAAAAVTPSPIAIAGLAVSRGRWRLAGQVVGCGNRRRGFEIVGGHGGYLRFRLPGRPGFTRGPRLTLSVARPARFAGLARLARRLRLAAIAVARFVALPVPALTARGGRCAARRLLRVTWRLRALAIAGIAATLTAAFRSAIAVLAAIAMLVATTVTLVAPFAPLLAPTARVALVAALAALVAAFARAVDR